MRAVFRTGTTVIVAVKPYAHSWGFRQSAENTALYDAIYRSIFQASNVTAATDDDDFGWLTIPLRSFDLPADGAQNQAAFEAVYRVCADNQDLLAFASPVDFTVVNDGDYVSAYKLRVPVDANGWKEKRAEIWETIAKINTYVADETGFSFRELPETAEERLQVAAALHNWLIENVSNNTGAATSGYWTHNAYSCLTRATPRYSDCSGFSAAYQFLCRLYGINCIQVMGGVGTGAGGATSEKINHSWNMLAPNLPCGKFVATAPKWYAVDVRFDQYVKDGKVKINGIAVTDTNRYCMTSYVYDDAEGTTVNGHDYTLRANNAVGYPVDTPSGAIGGTTL